jgi:hypothetical protein
MRQARITHQKTLVEAAHFTVKENVIDFGNDITKTHRDVYRKPAVSIFPIDTDFNLYLIKQFRYIHNAVLIESIAGMIDEDESPLDAAIRELHEETGMHAKEVKVFHKLYTEDIELYKIPLEEAVKQVISGEIMTASSACGILLLDEMKRRGEL